MIRHRILLLSALLCAWAQPACAQRFAFQQIAWGTPVDSVRVRLDSLGFAPQGVWGTGDEDFFRGDGTRLSAQMRDGRLVGFVLVDPARGAQVEERFRVLADSLQAALGTPDEQGEREQEAEDGEDEDGRTPVPPRPHRLWVAGLASVELDVVGPTAAPQLHLVWQGPGWHDEMSRRAGEPPQPAGFTTVRMTPFLRVAVDTTVRGRGNGALRGRFRIEYFQPITPQAGSVPQDPLDAVVYEMEFDCAGRRTRLISRTTYLEGRELASSRPAAQAWAVPQTDGHYHRGLDAVCRAARRG